jgi:serine/threonine protein kinase
MLNDSRADSLEKGVRIGDFEIEKRLGAGGMGIVYQARQVSTNRRVALKVLGPALSHGQGLDRFRREAQAVARLSHPAIAGLYFLGQDGDLCYHVMELVEGVPLRRILTRLATAREAQAGPDTVVSEEITAPPAALPERFDRPTADAPPPAPPDQETVDHEPDPTTFQSSSLTAAAKEMRASRGYVRRCCEIARDVAAALAYAHGAGVVHRDIKPENLMLDPDGGVHVIDFGLARFFDDLSITNTGQLVGTPLYMSPEQVTGRLKVDHRTDVYSLGLVLYELLALRPAIDHTSRENLLRNIVTKALPPLAARNRAVPKALEAVVHKATHKDAEERYQSAAEFAEDLDRFLAGKPVTAPTYRYRLDVQEIVARRPSGVVLAAFLCFMTGCAVLITMWSVAIMTALVADGGVNTYLVAGGQMLFATTYCGATAGLSLALLAGRDWARWVAAALSVLIAGACICVAIIVILSAFAAWATF